MEEPAEANGEHRMSEGLPRLLPRVHLGVKQRRLQDVSFLRLKEEKRGGQRESEQRRGEERENERTSKEGEERENERTSTEREGR